MHRCCDAQCHPPLNACCRAMACESLASCFINVVVKRLERSADSTGHFLMLGEYY